MLVAITPIEQADDLLWYRIDPSREVQVVDESGEVLPPGQEGLVRMRIDDGLDGDLDDPIATHEFFRDGYFYPGDFGEFGQDGRLALRGRMSDVVNVLGFKIATGAIEQALQDRLQAEGVCILSIPSRKEDATEDEIHSGDRGRAGRSSERKSRMPRMPSSADQASPGAHRLRRGHAAQRHGQDRSARAQGRDHPNTHSYRRKPRAIAARAGSHRSSAALCVSLCPFSPWIAPVGS
jgi:acyl-CoA synthetase (AMP-forming)/AMP-acid ligase II